MRKQTNRKADPQKIREITITKRPTTGDARNTLKATTKKSEKILTFSQSFRLFLGLRPLNPSSTSSQHDTLRGRRNNRRTSGDRLQPN